MRVLQVGNTDVLGNRFNGADLRKQLAERGIEASHMVWTKQSADPCTWALSAIRGAATIRLLLDHAESLFSLQSLLYPFSFSLLLSKTFRASDLVHYHLIHTGYFSIAALPLLTRQKPSVWTIHDPWAMTGHCTYPFSCEKWRRGCGSCPNLKIPMPLRKDRTHFMWNTKKLCYYLSDIDIVVASKFMLNMARESPLFSRFRLHHIPFGLDLTLFKPGNGEKAKQRLGVFPGSIVLTFRGTNNQYKGFSFIKKCLHRLNTRWPICLLSLEERGLVDEFRGRYQIIDLGWVNDLDLTITAYNASDIFLMPSVQEAFGMMAIEAMACGKCIIVFDGTSLPEVVFAPAGGVAVPQGDAEALRAALERLIDYPEERRELGANALKLARENYDVKTYVDRIIALYDDVIERRERGRR